MNEQPNPIKYSDLIKPDNSISDLIKQLEDLQKVYSDTAAKIKEQALQVTASLKGVSGATEEGRKAINDAAAATEKLTAEEKKVTQAEQKNTKALTELKLAQQEQNRIEKLQAKTGPGRYRKTLPRHFRRICRDRQQDPAGTRDGTDRRRGLACHQCRHHHRHAASEACTLYNTYARVPFGNHGDFSSSRVCQGDNDREARLCRTQRGL